MSQGGLYLCPEVHVLFGADWLRDGMKKDIAEAASCQYKASSKDLNGSASLTEQRELVSERFDTAGASTSFLGGCACWKGC